MFVQLKDVVQLNLFGQIVECKLADENVTPDEYLLSKIILGDGSDNIRKVFKGVGPKKALKLIRDKDKLKSMLKEDQDSAKQFILNRKLISFDEIPSELSDKIMHRVNETLFQFETLNKSEFTNIDWL